jgi:hypothetical protein
MRKEFLDYVEDVIEAMESEKPLLDVVVNAPFKLTKLS